jgi:hypothetical protein
MRMKALIMAVLIACGSTIHAEVPPRPPISEPVDTIVINVLEFDNLGSMSTSNVVSGAGSLATEITGATSIAIRTANLSVSATNGTCVVSLSVATSDGSDIVTREVTLLNLGAVNGNNSGDLAYPTPIVIEADAVIGEKVLVVRGFESSEDCIVSQTIVYEVLSQ